MFVTKRDGRREPLTVSKIKRVVAWGADGLDLNPLVLESKFDEFIKDGIKTDDIHQNLIYHARILTTPQEPEWSIVAGRLETIRRWKTTKAYDISFTDYLSQQISNGVYKHPNLLNWPYQDTAELGAYIDQSRDLNHSYGSVLTAQSKYLLKGECIQQMHMVNAMIIAAGHSDPLSFARKVYDALSLRKISLATPWLSNLRVGKSIASCFVVQIDDSIDSIFSNIHKIANISKNGGGVGVDMSKIRAKGSSVMGNPNASKGVTGWIKIINDTMVAVDQCFATGTAIHTAEGLADIDCATEGDLVLGADAFYHPIAAVLEGDKDTKLEEVLTIKTESGEVDVTKRHPILIVDSYGEDLAYQTKAEIIEKIERQQYSTQWVDAQDLKPNDLVIDYTVY